MGKLLIAILALVLGAVIGGIAMLSIGGGAMAGIGIATGLSAGICSTVQAAEDEGLLSAAQVDQVLNRAASELASLSGSDFEGQEIVGSATQCVSVMDKLRAAASE